MKSIASEVRKVRSRSTSGLAATTGGALQYPLLSEILAADKLRWKAAQQMNLPVLRLLRRAAAN